MFLRSRVSSSLLSRTFSFSALTFAEYWVHQASTLRPNLGGSQQSRNKNRRLGCPDLKTLPDKLFAFLHVGGDSGSAVDLFQLDVALEYSIVFRFVKSASQGATDNTVILG